MRPKNLTPEEKLDHIHDAIRAMIAREDKCIRIWICEGDIERRDYSNVRKTAMIQLSDAIKMAEIGRFEGYV